jgi:hypothetical protein
MSLDPRKIASIWNYVNCKDPFHPGVPACKTCGYILSIKSGNSSIEWHNKRINEKSFKNSFNNCHLDAKTHSCYY